MNDMPQRKLPVKVTKDELDLAYEALVEAKGRGGVTPMQRRPGVRQMANSYIVDSLGVTSSRAAYLLRLLIEMGKIERVEHSSRVVIVADKPKVDEAPVGHPQLTSATYERLKEAILKLREENQRLRQRIVDLEKEVGNLKDRVADLENVEIDPDLAAVLREIDAGLAV